MATKPKTEKPKSDISALVERLKNEATSGDTQIESRAKDLLTIIEHIG